MIDSNRILILVSARLPTTACAFEFASLRAYKRFRMRMRNTGRRTEVFLRFTLFTRSWNKQNELKTEYVLYLVSVECFRLSVPSTLIDRTLESRRQPLECAHEHYQSHVEQPPIQQWLVRKKKKERLRTNRNLRNFEDTMIVSDRTDNDNNLILIARLFENTNETSDR